MSTAQSRVAQDQTTPIRKYPTRLHVRCPQCRHQGVVTTFIDKPPKLRCTKCGSRDAVVCSRDRTRAWSVRRAGK